MRNKLLTLAMAATLALGVTAAALAQDTPPPPPDQARANRANPAAAPCAWTPTGSLST